MCGAIGNVAGRTKKTIISSATFVGYCVGNMCGSQIFKSKDAPRYTSGTVSAKTYRRLQSSALTDSHSRRSVQPSVSALNSSSSAAGGATTSGKTGEETKRRPRVGSTRRSRSGWAGSSESRTPRTLRTLISGTRCERISALGRDGCAEAYVVVTTLYYLSLYTHLGGILETKNFGSNASFAERGKGMLWKCKQLVPYQVLRLPVRQCCCCGALQIFPDTPSDVQKATTLKCR